MLNCTKLCKLNETLSCDFIMGFTFTVVVCWGEEGLKLHCGQPGEGKVSDHIKRNNSGGFGEIQMENSHLLTCIQLQP